MRGGASPFFRLSDEEVIEEVAHGVQQAVALVILVVVLVVPLVVPRPVVVVVASVAAAAMVRTALVGGARGDDRCTRAGGRHPGPQTLPQQSATGERDRRRGDVQCAHDSSFPCSGAIDPATGTWEGTGVLSDRKDRHVV
jgi:hypothetical protein